MLPLLSCLEGFEVVGMNNKGFGSKDCPKRGLFDPKGRDVAVQRHSTTE